MIGGLRVVPKIKITKAARRSSPDLRSCLKTRISCSIVRTRFHYAMHIYKDYSVCYILFQHVHDLIHLAPCELRVQAQPETLCPRHHSKATVY